MVRRDSVRRYEAILDSNVGKIKRLTTWLTLYKRIKKGPCFRYRHKKIGIYDFIKCNSIWYDGPKIYYMDDGIRKDLQYIGKNEYENYLIEWDIFTDKVRLYEKIT